LRLEHLGVEFLLVHVERLAHTPTSSRRINLPTNWNAPPGGGIPPQGLYRAAQLSVTGRKKPAPNRSGWPRARKPGWSGSRPTRSASPPPTGPRRAAASRPRPSLPGDRVGGRHGDASE